MALNVGDRLGHYDVTALIGEGGMGQVYQATDTKLKRQVALKIPSEAFSADPVRLARFQREAEVLASLNHPNIGHIYGLEEAEGIRALVLELVEGPTLADRITRGAIPLDEALPIAKQIAEALEAAHEAGVIHRDLKPANIKVKDDGMVKVLDFGLAKALDPSPDADPSESPTLTAMATQMGVIMGTAAYMSPEQARGSTVDRRADIWSFGVVLYEMLTGKRLFTGATVSDTLASVLKTDPDWNTLPVETPRSLRRLLRRSVERDRKRRLQHVGDARMEIEEALATPSTESAAAAAVQSRATVWGLVIPWTLAGVVLGGIVVGLTMWTLRPAPRPGSPARWVVSAPPSPAPSQPTLIETELAISPDGRLIVYRATVAGEDGLYVRPVDRLEGELLPGTAGAGSVFFSPDGTQVGFVSHVDGTLKKIRVSGGPAVTLCPVPPVIPGVTWGLDDMIIFATLGGLARVSAAGGESEMLTTPEAPVLHFWPEVLPNGRGVLFTIASSTGGNAQLAVLDLETGEQRDLPLRGTHPHYLSSGHLLYSVGDALWAVGVDADRFEVVGDPIPVLEGVTITVTGGANVAVSENGTLVYQRGSAQQDAARTLVWVDREGTAEVVAAKPRPYSSVRLSPDGRQVVTLITEGGNLDIWTYDLERDTPTRLTVDIGQDHFPILTPDGERVVWPSNRDGGLLNLFSKAADGTGQVERLTTSENPQVAFSWSSDGQSLVIVEVRPETGEDVGVVSTDGEIEWLLEGDSNEGYPEISPDGRWMAYVSDESGQPEIYVRPFPNVDDGRWPMSRDGGQTPVWGSDGRELFYRRLDDAAMMVVSIDTELTFSPGSSSVLFDAQEFLVTWPPATSPAFDFSQNSQRFLMIREDPAANRPDIIVVLNWFEELTRLVPIP